MLRADELRRLAAADPVHFWGEAARAIDWDVAFHTVLDRAAAGDWRWYAGGRLNTCFNAVDRHVERGRGDAPALIYHSAVRDLARTWSFRELQDEVARTAGMLARLSVKAGDRVVIFMPMIPEAVFAMLACARIGAVHSVVFGGFAAAELAKRIDDCEPCVLLTATCGLEGPRVVDYRPLVEGAIKACRFTPPHVIAVVRDEQPHLPAISGCHIWAEASAGATPVPCTSLAATDPLYILHTSGTTGTPKGVVRDNGGHAVALCWSMANIYGMKPGDTFWAASDIGWVVGHSYVVYGPLLAGCATVLFEGKPVGTPDAGTFWRVAARYDVAGILTAPTAIRVIRAEDPQGALLPEGGVPSLRTLFLAGEKADPATVEWARALLGVPVIDHWWQTELGWPALANCRGLDEQPPARGSVGKPVPGYLAEVLDASGSSVADGVAGSLALRLPLPPGCLAGIWDSQAKTPRRLPESPEGHYSTGDAAVRSAEGNFFLLGRTDDIINTAGHRLSTGAMEAVVAAHPDVAECAVVGVAHRDKGEVPACFVVGRNGAALDHPALQEELVARVRETIGPVAGFRSVHLVKALPKTRSGKILRRSLKALLEGRDEPVPSTIEDPAVLDDLTSHIRSYP